MGATAVMMLLPAWTQHADQQAHSSAS